MKKIVNFSVDYLKSLNWKFLILLSAFCLLLAVLNNFFFAGEKSVEWVGSQQILEKPEDL